VQKSPRQYGRVAQIRRQPIADTGVSFRDSRPDNCAKIGNEYQRDFLDRHDDHFYRAVPDMWIRQPGHQ
jgi:hypothetical protein